MARNCATSGVRRLLPGEIPATQDLDEIRHWYAVYAELWEGCLEICNGLAGSEKVFVLARAERFHAGFQYWTERRREYFAVRRPVPELVS